MILDLDIAQLQAACEARMQTAKIPPMQVMNEIGHATYQGIVNPRNLNSRTKRINTVISAMVFVGETDMAKFSCPANLDEKHTRDLHTRLMRERFLKTSISNVDEPVSLGSG